MRWSNFHRSENLSRFASALPKKSLHPAVLAWADADRAKSRWAVAFSGGADSLALLLSLWIHWPQRRDQLIALHFNHHLRGRAADADEAFCRRVCAGLDITLRVGHWRKPPAGPSEAEARDARFEFFDRTLTRHRARALWLGHQQDDIAESLLMRLARGSGTSGLAAPRPCQMIDGKRIHLRPLLALKKAEITRALSLASLPWREDATNLGSTFLRNRMRLDVVPAWQKACGERDVLGGAALARELLEEDDTALEFWIDQLLPSKMGKTLYLESLRGKPRAILRRALRRWLVAQAEAGELSRAAFVTLLAALENGRTTRQSLGKNGFAVLTADSLVFQPVTSTTRLKSNT